jgi:hypothetical protein
MKLSRRSLSMTLIASACLLLYSWSPAHSTETPSSLPAIAGSAEAGWSFDQLITFGRQVNAVAFENEFHRAESVHYDVFVALRELQRVSMLATRAPYVTPFDHELSSGVARRYSFRGDLLRVDDLNARRSYIVNCSTRSVIALDHNAHVASRVTLPNDVYHWTTGQPWVISKVSSAAPVKRVPVVSIAANFEASIYKIDIRVQAHRNSSTDGYIFRYDKNFPAVSCPASDVLPPTLISGVLGPQATMLLYKEQFAARNIHVDLPTVQPPQQGFSSSDFRLGTFAYAYGSIVRGDLTESIQDDIFEIPSTYRIVQVPVDEHVASELLPP